MRAVAGVPLSVCLFVTLWLLKALTRKVHSHSHVHLQNLQLQVRISRASGRGQGHVRKTRVCVSCLRMVCLRLEGNLDFCSVFLNKWWYDLWCVWWEVKPRSINTAATTIRPTTCTCTTITTTFGLCLTDLSLCSFLRPWADRQVVVGLLDALTILLSVGSGPRTAGRCHMWTRHIWHCGDTDRRRHSNDMSIRGSSRCARPTRTNRWCSYTSQLTASSTGTSSTRRSRCTCMEHITRSRCRVVA